LLESIVLLDGLRMRVGHEYYCRAPHNAKQPHATSADLFRNSALALVIWSGVMKLKLPFLWGNRGLLNIAKKHQSFSPID
jgi:hypothetical protein